VLATRQQVGASCAIRVMRTTLEQNQEPSYGVSFDAPCHPRHVCRGGPQKSCERGFFSLSLSHPRKSCYPLKKTWVKHDSRQKKKRVKHDFYIQVT